MIFYIFIMLIIITSGLYFLFRVFYRKWEESAINQKLENEKFESEMVDKIEKNYDPVKIKKNKSIIDFFKNN